MTRDTVAIIVIGVFAGIILVLGGVWAWHEYSSQTSTGETTVVKTSSRRTIDSQVDNQSEILAASEIVIEDDPAPVVRDDLSNLTTPPAPVVRENPVIPTTPPVPFVSHYMPRTRLMLPPFVIHFPQSDSPRDAAFFEDRYEKRFGGELPYRRVPKFNYYFGRECPASYEDLGRAGILRPKIAEPGYPFEDGKMLDSDWVWTHPRLCKGYVGDTTENLYGLTDYLTSSIPTRILLGDKFFREGEEPADLTEYDDRWSWADVYLAPASKNFAISLVEKPNPDNSYRENYSKDGIGILMANDDLDNIKELDIGQSYDNENTWIHPYLMNIRTSDFLTN